MKFHLKKKFQSFMSCIHSTKKNLSFVIFFFFSLAIFAQVEEEEFFIKIEKSQDKMVVGELAYLNLVIYTKVGIQDIYLQSEFGFSNQNGINTQFNNRFNGKVEEKEINGNRYVYKPIKQLILYPFLEGKYSLSDIEVVINRRDPNDSTSMFNPFAQLYDTLKLKEPYYLTIDSLPKESRYAPKNGENIAVEYKDSLSDKGIWIVDVEHTALSNPILIQPIDFGLSDDSTTVKIELIEDSYKILDGVFYSTKTFRHIISFHEKGDYALKPEWSTWNTKEDKWQTIKGEEKTITVTKTSTKQTTDSSIVDKAEDTIITEDIVFLVDVSTSMLAQDFSPNRYGALKVLLNKMIASKTRNQQISIVIFGGESMILCPLTADTSKLFAAIDNILINKLANGTAIGEGMMFGLYELSKSTKANKHLFILTDGVNNTGFYSPNLAAQIANQLSVQVHSFGIGCEGEALTPIAIKADSTFTFANTKVEIDELILKNIGQQTGGNYTRITCDSDFEKVNNLKELIEKTKPKNPILTKIPNEFILTVWSDIQFENERTKKKYYAK